MPRQSGGGGRLRLFIVSARARYVARVRSEGEPLATRGELEAQLQDAERRLAEMDHLIEDLRNPPTRWWQSKEGRINLAAMSRALEEQGALIEKVHSYRFRIKKLEDEGADPYA